ncbi:MAG: WecB/TagA/CpsF family glycosyltransferase [Clostridia bacterium]
MFIVTANPETIMTAEQNGNFKKALLDENTTIIPDGIGIVKGAKILGYHVKETIPGVELCTKLFEYCNQYSKSIFLLGAKKEVVEKLVNVLKNDYPNAHVCGYENGYIEDRQAVFNKISKLKPDVLLVALGIPDQELLIYKNLAQFNKGIFVGVGGSFDVLSGIKKRAPKIFIKLHLEWLYRILKEPQRLKRFFNSNVKYLFKLNREKNILKGENKND